jgi:hypothetical protein
VRNCGVRSILAVSAGLAEVRVEPQIMELDRPAGDGSDGSRPSSEGRTRSAIRTWQPGWISDHHAAKGGPHFSWIRTHPRTSSSEYQASISSISAWRMHAYDHGHERDTVHWYAGDPAPG